MIRLLIAIIAFGCIGCAADITQLKMDVYDLQREVIYLNDELEQEKARNKCLRRMTINAIEDVYGEEHPDLEKMYQCLEEVE